MDSVRLKTNLGRSHASEAAVASTARLAKSASWWKTIVAISLSRSLVGMVCGCLRSMITRDSTSPSLSATALPCSMRSPFRKVPFVLVSHASTALPSTVRLMCLELIRLSKIL